MKFLATFCLAVFCLAHSSEPDRRKHDRNSMIYLTDKRSELYDEPQASFVGGGVMQDSCRGEVTFTSELNHNSWHGHAEILNEIDYKITFTDGTEREFNGEWHWKATASFMAELNFDEDETWGHEGDEDGWQEECGERSTNISQCDRIFGYNRYTERSERWYPNNGILTGRGDLLNPIYYEITFNSETKDGCTLKWTDRLVFKLRASN